MKESRNTVQNPLLCCKRSFYMKNSWRHNNNVIHECENLIWILRQLVKYVTHYLFKCVSQQYYIPEEDFQEYFQNHEKTILTMANNIFWNKIFITATECIIHLLQNFSGRTNFFCEIMLISCCNFYNKHPHWIDYEKFIKNFPENLTLTIL